MKLRFTPAAVLAFACSLAPARPDAGEDTGAGTDAGSAPDADADGDAADANADVDADADADADASVDATADADAGGTQACPDFTGPTGLCWDLTLIRDPSALNASTVSETSVITQLVPQRLRELRFRSREWTLEDGPADIQIEAYAVLPASSAGARRPGVVLLHGLGGEASPSDAEKLAADLGVVTLTLSGPGQGASTGRDSSAANLFPLAEEPRMSWFYSYAETAMRALTYLAAQPEVDATRLGLSGYSGGALTTFIVNGLDDRLDAAVPISASGELERANDHGGWTNLLLQGAGIDATSPRWHAFLDHFDPIHYAPHAHAPVELVNGAQDEFFPLDSTDLTFAALPGAAHRTGLIANWDHGLFTIPSAQLQTFDNSEQASRRAHGYRLFWLERHLNGGSAAAELPPVPSLTLTAFGQTTFAQIDVPTGYTVEDAWVHTSADQAYTFVSWDLDRQSNATWSRLLLIDPAQHNDTNMAYFGEVELSWGLLPKHSMFVTTRPHLPPGFSPQVRNAP